MKKFLFLVSIIILLGNILSFAQVNDLIRNGSFNDPVPGTTTPWQINGSVDVEDKTGCNDEGYAGLWGNLAVGESFYQYLATSNKIIAGHYYKPVMCIKYNVDPGKTQSDIIRFRFFAYNGSDSWSYPPDDPDVPDIDVIAVTETDQTNWTQINDLPAWKAEQNFDKVGIKAENEFSINEGDYTSYGAIDKIQLIEVCSLLEDITFTNTSGCCYDILIENNVDAQTFTGLKLIANNNDFEFTDNFTLPSGWSGVNNGSELEITIPSGMALGTHNASLCFNNINAQHLDFTIEWFAQNNDVVCSQNYSLSCTMLPPDCNDIDLYIEEDPERECCYQMFLDNNIGAQYQQPYHIVASVDAPTEVSVAWLPSNWVSDPPFTGTPVWQNTLAFKPDPLGPLPTGNQIEYARVCLEHGGVSNPVINFKVYDISMSNVLCEFEVPSNCNSCSCDDMQITYTKYDSDDPDHKCCVEVTIHADCDIPEISSIIFDDNAYSAGIANHSSPQTWSQSYGKFTNSEGYLAEGDHKFILCIGSDNPNEIEDFELSFEDSINNKVCNDSTITVSCDSGCCDKTHFNFFDHHEAGGRSMPNILANCEAEPLSHPKSIYWSAACNCKSWNSDKIQINVYSSLLPTFSGNKGSWIRFGINLAYSKLTYDNDLFDDISERISGTIYKVQGNPATAGPSCSSLNNHELLPYNLGAAASTHYYGSLAQTAPSNFTGSLDGPYGGFREKYYPCCGKEVYWGSFDKSAGTFDGIIWTNTALEFDKTDDRTSGWRPEILEFGLRYSITDENCCTCDTLIHFKVKIPSLALGTPSEPPASFEMENLTNGTLKLSLGSSDIENSDVKIKTISLETLAEDVQITSMKDPVTGEEAEIKDNIAYLTGGEHHHYYDSLYAVVIEWANPNQDYMFSNKVGITFESDDESGQTTVWQEEFEVIAQVPHDGDPDLLEEGDLPEGKAMRTIALHLTNMNVYEEPISHIMLQAATEDCKVAAVGKPVDFGEGRVLVDFSELEDELYVQGKDHDDLMDSIYLDSLYVPDAEKPGHRKIVPGETVQPLYITVTTPGDFEGPLALNYKTYNEEGIELSSGEVTTLITGITKEIDPPSELMLNCFPNPANTEVTFSIEAARGFEEVSITITDLQGNKISSVITGKYLDTGRHLIPYNISALPSGSYYYTIKSGSISKTKLMNIVR